jgi:hypothetical protein
MFPILTTFMLCFSIGDFKSVAFVYLQLMQLSLMRRAIGV